MSSGVTRLNLSRLTKAAKKIANELLSQTIRYEKNDGGKIAKDIVRARKNKQTKNYRDSIKKGYEILGKQAPKREDKRKQPPTGSTGIGVGM